MEREGLNEALGLVISCIVLGRHYLWRSRCLARGPVMWMTRVLFVFALDGAIGSILARRRDANPSGVR